VFKTIQRIFQKDGLDPQARFTGNGGAVTIAGLLGHLERVHDGGRPPRETGGVPLDRLRAPLGKVEGDER
jgi:hypothetical protein